MTLVNGNGTLFEKNEGIPKLQEPQSVPFPEPAPEPAPVAPSDSSLAPPTLPDPKDESAQASLKPTSAQLTLRPASVSTKVGEEIRVDLTGQDIPSIEKSRVTISFDPEIVQFTQALEGTFWKQNNISPSLSFSASPHKGQVVIQMGQAGQSAKGGGQLATLIFKAKASGNSRLEIQHPSFLQPDNKPVTVITQHGRISVH